MVKNLDGEHSALLAARHARLQGTRGAAVGRFITTFWTLGRRGGRDIVATALFIQISHLETAALIVRLPKNEKIVQNSDISWLSSPLYSQGVKD